MREARPISAFHRPQLDGVRGLAIIAVLALHLTIDWPQYPTLRALTAWGWLGVDLFFVLSGYLITGILADTRGSTTYYLSFYGRRLLRIVPPYALLLLLLMTIAPFTGWMHREEHAALLERQWWYWSYSVNILLTHLGSSATPFSTGHLWSLAVEEQFYLIWPFLVARTRSNRGLARLSLALIAGAPILRLALLATGSPRAAMGNYLLTPCRADALAWGALLAALEREGRERIEWLWPQACALGGLILAIVVVRLGSFGFPSPSMQLFGYSAIAAFSAGLVGYALTRRAGWLEWPWLRVAGRYSYGIYLWHQIAIFVVLRELRLPWVGSALTSLGATFALVAVSWLVVERPALLLKQFVPRDAPADVPAEASLIGVDGFGFVCPVGSESSDGRN